MPYTCSKAKLMLLCGFHSGEKLKVFQDLVGLLAQPDFTLFGPGALSNQLTRLITPSNSQSESK